MRHVFIYRKDKIDELFFEKEITYHSIWIQEKKNGIAIDSHLLKEEQMLSYMDYIFIHMPQLTYSLIHLKDEMLIGRDSSLDIHLQSDLISNLHARIYKENNQYFIEDLNSANGLFYKSNRISLLPLENGMSFYLVNVRCIYFDSYLLISYPISSHPIPSVFQQDECFENHEIIQPPSSFSVCKIELESYIMDRAPMKQKLFQSIGSSIMILVSSFVSCLVMYTLYPEQKTQLLSMVLMSGSMSLSFLLFGLYNRSANYNTSIKQIKENKEQYLSYLKTIEARIDALKKENINQVSILQQDALQIQRMEKIPLCIQSVQGIEFIYRKWNYQQMNHDMVSILQNWMDTHQIDFDKVIYLDHQSYYIQATMQWAYGFFEMISKNMKDIKVLWQTKEVRPSILCHPFCTVGFTRLWIHDEESFQRIYPLIDENTIEFIDEEIDQTKSGIKLYISNNGVQPIPYLFNALRYHKQLYIVQTKERIQPFLKREWKDEANLKVCAGFHDENPIWIDFKEGEDGPHGLVAGSTGYGKSEWLSNILLQLVYQNKPSYFQYILIDFKGGAFGSTFTAFPHFAGMVTNLDEDIQRFVTYISKFIQNRQTILKDFQEKHPSNIAHVDAYNELNFQNPLSHVFIIVDEFAQMKTQAMELFNYIKQLARIGRSLGIHLILSTQKPLGIIDDQIWANSNFHVCLKVLSQQDSKEVLHNDHAYYLKKAGEFILQSQHQEIQGMGIYIHQKMDDNYSYIEVNEKDEIIKDVSKKTYLDKVSNELLDLNIKQNRIIPDSISKQCLDDKWCIYEDMENVCFKEFQCTLGQVVSILTEDIQMVVKSIVSCSEHPVYSLNIMDVEDIVDSSFFDDSLYWKIKDQTNPMTLILNIESFSLWKSLFLKSNLQIYLIFSQVKNSFLSYLESYPKMCAKHSNVDSIRSFFQVYSLQAGNYLKKDNQIYSCRINERCADIKKNKVLLQEDDNRLEIGVDEQYKTIYWDSLNPLLICFVQKSMKKKIEQLLNHWKSIKPLNIQESMENDFDICICDVIAHPEILSSKNYLQNQYDLDVLWVGKGCMDYSYLLHKNVPLQAMDMIYWHEDEKVGLTWKEY